jgi:hypothetical protein
VQDAYLADAGTGKRLAVFKPPSDAIFADVAASADDKTFVLDAAVGPDVGTSGSMANASRTAPRSHILYVLRLTPGTAQQFQLTRVPIASSFTDAAIWGLAVSPDGRTLAIVFQAGVNDASHKTPIGPETLQTYSLATGRALRTWTGPTNSSQRSSVIDIDNANRLSWLDDGRTIAFVSATQSTHKVIRTLNTNSPGTSLLTDSQPVFPMSASCYLPLMTSDGQAVICGTEVLNDRGCVNGQPELTAYSVATGKPERVLYRYRGRCSFGFTQAEWAKSGTLAIGNIEMSKPVNPPPPVTNMFGVVTPDKFTSLPVTLIGSSYSLGKIAF